MQTKDRKKDHIDLAFDSQIKAEHVDKRFYYEPLMKGHPTVEAIPSFKFGEKVLKVPMWVSSMTGGTSKAKMINHNLARVCKQFGIGMGLGSCRPLLTGDTYLSDFNIRTIMGDEGVLYANLGIAQIEELLDRGHESLIAELVNKLSADGLIVHVNPLQEWLQPEGDYLKYPPIDTIKRLLDKLDISLIVKEVGQGFGPRSIEALMRLPLAAIEFAAHGGTNFSKLEISRNIDQKGLFGNLALIGHTAEEMVEMTNKILLKKDILCKNVIISGGIKNFLSGYYLINKLNTDAIFGQASMFLKYASKSYNELEEYVSSQINGLALAYNYLRIKDD